MAGDWIKMECSLPDKPETLAITAAMGWDDPDLTVGKLMRVFRWFDQQTLNGNAPGVTAALLDRVIGVTGFVQAMRNVGWIVVADDGLSLHNFDRHNGETAKKRAQTAKRVANHRSNAKGNDEGNADSVTEALAREEKRREEKKEPKGSVARGDLPQCSPQSIIDLYHEVLPELPSVRLTTEARKKAVAKLWRWVLTSTKTDGSRRAFDADQAMTWLRDYFTRARDNDFLMGRTGRTGEHANWQCDFDFLLTEKGMKHVIEKTKESA